MWVPKAGCRVSLWVQSFSRRGCEGRRGGGSRGLAAGRAPPSRGRWVRASAVASARSRERAVGPVPRSSLTSLSQFPPSAWGDEGVISPPTSSRHERHLRWPAMRPSRAACLQGWKPSGTIGFPGVAKDPLCCLRASPPR